MNGKTRENPMFALQESTTRTGRRGRYSVGLARTCAEIEEAQHLRYQVFRAEMGATLGQSKDALELDEDDFDADCRHLIVRDHESLKVVGCYRILTPEAARARGGYYSDREFDLSRLEALRPVSAEVGRACIHPDYRSGSVILLLWSGLARFLDDTGCRYAIGCASIPLADGHANAVQVYRDVAAQCLAPQEMRVTPRHPYPLRDVHPIAALNVPKVPPLIKGYMRLNAWIGGEPAWDPDFGTADLFVMLSLARMPTQYVRHFQAAA
jgi:putative hemolysin